MQTLRKGEKPFIAKNGSNTNLSFGFNKCGLNLS